MKLETQARPAGGSSARRKGKGKAGGGGAEGERARQTKTTQRSVFGGAGAPGYPKSSCGIYMLRPRHCLRSPAHIAASRGPAPPASAPVKRSALDITVKGILVSPGPCGSAGWSAVL